MSDFVTKQQDTRNGMEVTLLSDDEPINLTNCTVDFIMKRNDIYIKKQATITDKSEGEVLVNFTERDLENVGIYKAEFIILFPDNTKETFPNDGYLEIKIYENLEE